MAPRMVPYYSGHPILVNDRIPTPSSAVPGAPDLHGVPRSGRSWRTPTPTSAVCTESSVALRTARGARPVLRHGLLHHDPARCRTSRATRCASPGKVPGRSAAAARRPSTRTSGRRSNQTAWPELTLLAPPAQRHLPRAGGLSAFQGLSHVHPPLSRPRRPDDLVRVRVQAEERFVGPLWGLYFGEQPLRACQPGVCPARRAAQRVRGCLSAPAHRRGEPGHRRAAGRTAGDRIHRDFSRAADRPRRAPRRDRSPQAPIPDRGVPSEPIPRKKRAVVRLPIGPVVPPAAPHGSYHGDRAGLVFFHLAAAARAAACRRTAR